MNTEVHGHEVMRMMIESGRTYTRASLRAAIVGKFGEETRFHTCSAEGMTADELISFLEMRGKFLAADTESFSLPADRMCNH